MSANHNRKSSDAPSILERVSPLYWSLIIILVMSVAAIQSVKIYEVLTKTPSVRLKVIGDLYDQAVRSRNEAILANSSLGSSSYGRDPIGAQEQANSDYLALQQQVNLLPKGEKVPVRVTQFLSDGPAVFVVAIDEGHHRDDVIMDGGSAK